MPHQAALPVGLRPRWTRSTARRSAGRSATSASWPSVGAIAIFSLWGMGKIAGLMGNEFVNAEDRGQFVVDIELPAGTSLDETWRPHRGLRRRRSSRTRTSSRSSRPSARTATRTRRSGASSTKPKSERKVTLARRSRTRSARSLQTLPDAKVAVIAAGLHRGRGDRGADHGAGARADLRGARAPGPAVRGGDQGHPRRHRRADAVQPRPPRAPRLGRSRQGGARRRAGRADGARPCARASRATRRASSARARTRCPIRVRLGKEDRRSIDDAARA